MDFTKKNNFVVRHNGAQHFHKDLETFKTHFPNHPLNAQLAKANQFSFARLDSQMLFIMIGTLTPETILSGREDNQNPIATGRIDQIKSMITQSGLNVDEFTEEDFARLSYLSFSELEHFISSFIELKSRDDSKQKRIEEVKTMISESGLNLEEFSEQDITELASGSDDEIKDLLESIRLEKNLAPEQPETPEDNQKTTEITSKSEESDQVPTEITSETPEIKPETPEAKNEVPEIKLETQNVKPEVTPVKKKAVPAKKKPQSGKKGSSKKNSPK